MYVSNLKIKNYRNFCGDTFNLKLQPFTLIIGENNIGKSNLLNAIGLILSQDITMFKKRMLEIDDINFKARDNFKRTVINIEKDAKTIEFPEIVVELLLEGMSEEQLVVVADWLCNEDLSKAKLTYVFKPRTGFDKEKWILQQRENIKDVEKPLDKLKMIDFPLAEYEYVIFGGNSITNRCEPYFLRMLKFECLDALRDAKKELSASGEYRLLYRVLDKRDHIEYKDIKSILNELETQIFNNSSLKAIKSELMEFLDKISLQEEYGNSQVDFSFNSPETNEILKKIGLVYGVEPILIERNGLGRNNLLYISLILSHLVTQSKGTDYNCFRLIGIEEPEAHLHPHLQNHLGKNIKSCTDTRTDIQTIITSHSTHITSTLSLDNTVVIYKDNNSGEIKNHYINDGFSGKAQNKRYYRYLEKYLDATKCSMFYARKIILVEGIAEQLLIPKFFEIQTKKTIERIGCNVINVQGVAFKNFLEVIKNGYFIKCVAITDGDKGKHTEDRAENLKDEYKALSQIDIQINTDTFEKEIVKVNTTGKGKDILLNALEKTRPVNGKKLREQLGEKPINVDDFFKEVEDYKAEFAFDLLEILSTNNEDFVIPVYIKNAFSFIVEQKNEEA